MGLKKKTGEIYSRLVEQIFFSNIFKSSTSITNLVKTRGLEILYVTILFIFSAGIINGILEGSQLPAGHLIWPRSGVQTTAESLVYIFIMATGSAGLYFLYTGTQEKFKRRVSDFYVIFGFSFVLIAVVLSLYIFTIKT